MKNYRTAVAVPEDIIQKLSAYTPITQQLLFNRGICDPQEAEAFLNPSFENDLHDPFLLHDMEVAVSRILEAIQNKEKIAVFSDYDCDGIPGAVVLHDFFTTISYTDFITYIPHRHFEGFGFSTYAVEKLAEENVQLIITVDCGTTSFEAVSMAKEKGIEVIITDHHQPKDTLPEAVAVVNPQVGDTYPFTGLCGAAVAFKLVQALIARGVAQEVFAYGKEQEKWLLDMVGIATITDMVPLTGENRALAHYGLHVLRKSRRVGVQQLLRKQGVQQRHLTEDDIGFTIGPRINAASRMDTPEDAFAMLTLTDEGEAGAKVAHLEHLNNERRGLVAAMTKEIKQRMERAEDIPSVLVLGNPQWRPSLVGLAANKLAEEYKRPAFLWGRDGNGVIKGSCRSDGAVSLITLMQAIQDSFIEHGGHHMSGGFSIHEDRVHTLSQDINDAFVALGEKALIVEDCVVDAELSLDALDYKFLRSQQQLAPFGMDNPKPLYMFKDVSPFSVALFGKTKEHTKLTFDTQGIAKEAIAFFKLPEDFSSVPEIGKKVSLLAHLEQSYFMGRQQTRLRIVDIV